MRRLLTTLTLSGALVAATAPVVVASDGPRCSELFGGNPHGYHIIADYVTGIGSELLGGPGIAWPPVGVNAAGGADAPGAPKHGGALPPGASFCPR